MTKEELTQKYEQIPQDMKKLRRWVCYNIETRDGAETKVPINALSGTYARSNDSITWTSFNLAISGCVKYHCTGIGFMLGKDDLGVSFFGIDLDNHPDKKTGQKPFSNQDDFEEFAHIFITKLNSYTEYSHSGEGIHIICRGVLPEGGRRKGAVEMYDSGRFFTMTGNVINPVEIGERTEEIKPIWEEYINVQNEAYNSTFTPRIDVKATIHENGSVTFEEIEKVISSPTYIDDDVLVEKIRNSQQGEEFMRLYNGDMSSYDNDHSRADAAFCQILAFWTGCDAVQMDRIMRKSALIREKWDRKQRGTTYGALVIEKAISNQREVYTPPKEVKEKVVAVKTVSKEHNFDENQVELLQLDEKGDPIVELVTQTTPYSYTDTGNAERMYDYFGKYFRFNTDNKNFLFWNGKTWINDGKCYIKKFADKLIEVLRKEIKENEKLLREIQYKEREAKETGTVYNPEINSDELEDLLKAQKANLQRISNRAGKEALIGEFEHLHEIPVEVGQLDKHPYLLNTDSGVVNLLTGEIKPWDKTLYLTKNTNVAVSFEEPTTWLKFLHDILKRPNEEETEQIIKALQLLLGDALTGRTNKEYLTVLYGNGSNGKSTFIKTINKIFGDYAKTINSELLLQSRTANSQSTEFSYASLLGARILSMSETNEGEKMNDKIIKQMTSGEEMPAQYKFGKSFSYEPTFSPWMSTNNLPVIRSKDYGIWRRIFLIPFLVKFTDENKDIHMPEKLAAEMPKILGWMIQGCVELNKLYNGVVRKPKCLEEALSDYKNDMDSVNNYISSRCQNFPGYKTNAINLYQDYKKWALDNNEFLMPESKFKAEIVSHGFALKKDVNQGHVYVGIKLNSDQKGHIFEDAE